MNHYQHREIGSFEFWPQCKLKMGAETPSLAAVGHVNNGRSAISLVLRSGPMPNFSLHAIFFGAAPDVTMTKHGRGKDQVVGKKTKFSKQCFFSQNGTGDKYRGGCVSNHNRGWVAGARILVANICWETPLGSADLDEILAIALAGYQNAAVKISSKLVRQKKVTLL